MPVHRPALRVICLSLLCVPLAAQTRHYYVQLADGQNGQRVILANASAKAIEAFHGWQKCESAGEGGVGGEISHDILSHEGQGGWMDLDGKFVRGDLIEPWGRMVLGLLAPQPSKCEWKVDIDVVIYADGTYEGDETAARYLQLYRDGIAAGIKYWDERFRQENAGTPNFEATLADAKRISDDGTKKAWCIKTSLICKYLRGRSQVDRNIALRGESERENPAQRYNRMVQETTGWRMKLDADVALKQLELTFPLPAELASAATEPRTQAR